MYTIIMAGGSGERLWPLSRKRFPKQFIKFNNKKLSLFQETFLRAKGISNVENIIIVTNKDYKFLILKDIQELNIKFNLENLILEPESKNTLPAIYSGIRMVEKEKNELICVLPSDHIIKNNKEFIRTIKASKELAMNSIVTFGIIPTTINTNYGYIKPGMKKMNGNSILQFKEKPTYDLAAKYLREGYLWNSGIFLFSSSIFIEEVKKYSTKLHNLFDNNSNLDYIFSEIHDGIQFDKEVLEKSEKVSVVTIDIGWNDLGNFESLGEVFDSDKNNNITNSKNFIVDSKNNIILTEKDKTVAIIDVNDLIIIEKKDAILISKKNRTNKIRSLIKEIKINEPNLIKYHKEDFRPWGFYRVIDESKAKYKVKKICLYEGKKISYQMHNHRSEFWIIVKGIAKIIIDDVAKTYSEGEFVHIKKKQKHRLENIGTGLLELIEVQKGDYLEEDDIVRFIDDYGRK